MLSLYIATFYELDLFAGCSCLDNTLDKALEYSKKTVFTACESSYMHYKIMCKNCKMMFYWKEKKVRPNFISLSKNRTLGRTSSSPSHLKVLLCRAHILDDKFA